MSSVHGAYIIDFTSNKCSNMYIHFSSLTCALRTSAGADIRL